MRYRIALMFFTHLMITHLFGFSMAVSNKILIYNL
jgi:hypothetical protein